MFAEDMSVFFDTQTGFALTASVGGESRSMMLDAPGVETLQGEVNTVEPSFLMPADEALSEGDVITLTVADLPPYLAAMAGDYIVRYTQPAAPDGAIVRAVVAREG